MAAIGSLLVVALTVAGCGSSTSSTSATQSLSRTSSAGSTALTARQVVTELKAHGLPVTGVIVYTAATDPNHQLGRPNGYTSKAAWVDSRIDASQVKIATKGSIDAGGGVEVYPTAAGAMARAKYIARIAAHISLVNEYDYVSGDAVLRLSTALTPAQAQGYARVIGATLVTAG
jgi:hypothetical protein